MPIATEHVDVIIAGAGLSGSTLACALLQGGLKIALLGDGGNNPIMPIEQKFGSRVFAVTRAAERIFRSLSVWDNIPPQRISPFREMRVWDKRGAIHFDSAALGEPVLGYIIEAGILQQALQQNLHQFPEQLARYPAQLRNFRVDGNKVSVELDDGKQLSATLLAGADGGCSKVREISGIACEQNDYKHHALVANVRTAQSHGETAWQHFLPAGPLAFLPLPDPHLCSIVWSCEKSQAAYLQGLNAPEFNTELEKAFERRLGNVEWSGERKTFPLYRRHAKQYIRRRIALLGDAAHTIHPLAGQGANLGLLDAATLSEVILATYAAQRDFGLSANLRAYERRRRGQNQTMLWAMDAFKLLFGNRLPPVSMLRNLGLNLTDALPMVKQSIMRQAMGLEGDLPQLALATF